MKTPDQTHNGNLNKSKVIGTPDAGARLMAGKSNEPDGALIKGSAPTAVTTATENKGACLAAGLRQRITDDGSEASNPKHRTTNSWGINDGTKK